MTTSTSTTFTSTTFNQEERNRLYWHSRRGMLELDLLLLPFLEESYPTLSPELQASYQRLITLEDQDLFLWLMQREPVGDAQLQAIVDLIAAHAQHSNLDQFKNL